MNRRKMYFRVAPTYLTIIELMRIVEPEKSQLNRTKKVLLHVQSKTGS